MAKSDVDYALGQLGVNIVASPLHLPDGSLTVANNLDFVRDQGVGGIGSRYGMAPLNAVALAGSVVAGANIPLPLVGDPQLLVTLNANVAASSWKKTTDGAAYTDVLTATLQRAAGMVRNSISGGVMNPSNFYVNQRPAFYENKLFFGGDNYIQYDGVALAPTNPPIVQWDGTTAFEVLRVPRNPSSPSDSKTLWISDFWVNDGVIYLSVWDFGGGASDHKGRVIAYNPLNGNLEVIGERFGDDTGEKVGGFPHCLTSYQGSLFAGTNVTGGGASGPLIYRIQPGAAEQWTLDDTPVAGGAVVSMAVYNGELYAGTSTNNAGNVVVRRRTALGVWSASYTAALNPGYVGGLIVFAGSLFGCEFLAGTRTLIKEFDGSSWSTDKNIGVDVAIRAPGNPVIFGSDLYWPFFDSVSDATATGFLMKRTSAGVWSTVFSGTGLRGLMGKFTPDA